MAWRRGHDRAGAVDPDPRRHLQRADHGDRLRQPVAVEPSRHVEHGRADGAGAVLHDDGGGAVPARADGAAAQGRGRDADAARLSMPGRARTRTNSSRSAGAWARRSGASRSRRAVPPARTDDGGYPGEMPTPRQQSRMTIRPAEPHGQSVRRDAASQPGDRQSARRRHRAGARLPFGAGLYRLPAARTRSRSTSRPFCGAPSRSSISSAVFGFDLFCAWLDVFLMSFFFLLSGLFVWPSLTRKGPGAFLQDRLLRLGLPFAAVVLLLMPLAHYPTYLQSAGDPTHCRLSGGIGWHCRSGRAGRCGFCGCWSCGICWRPGSICCCAGTATVCCACRPTRGSARRSFSAGCCSLSALAYVPLALIFGPSDWVQRRPVRVPAQPPAALCAVFLRRRGDRRLRHRARPVRAGRPAGAALGGDGWSRRIVLFFAWGGLTALYPDPWAGPGRRRSRCAPPPG